MLATLTLVDDAPRQNPSTFPRKTSQAADKSCDLLSHSPDAKPEHKSKILNMCSGF
jgi:hypothetical protein